MTGSESGSESESETEYKHLYYDGLAEQPSDIRWLRGPRTSQIELHKMTTTHFKPTILVNIRYYVMISGKNFTQQGAAVL